jgi:ubiquinone biosynthesis monooxygenase Coq7
MRAIAARLRPGETLGDRVLRVDHNGEHGAVCVYRAQRRVARWTAPAMRHEIDGFIAHERRHRALFAAEIARRGQQRCPSYGLCGAAGTMLGLATGVLGTRAIAATTVAIERVVLEHMHAQIAELGAEDPDIVALLRAIIADEQAHHDESHLRLRGGAFEALLLRLVSSATEIVIWIGMRR